MVDKAKIFNRIEYYLTAMENEISMKLEIHDKYTKEYNDFWYFVYNSNEYLQNKNGSNALTGNLPVLIDKHNGDIYELLIFNFDLHLSDEIINLPLEDIIRKDALRKWA